LHAPILKQPSNFNYNNLITTIDIDFKFEYVLAETYAKHPIKYNSLSSAVVAWFCALREFALILPLQPL
jgi:hypothetical protein